MRLRYAAACVALAGAAVGCLSGLTPETAASTALLAGSLSLLPPGPLTRAAAALSAIACLAAAHAAAARQEALHPPLAVWFASVTDADRAIEISGTIARDAAVETTGTVRVVLAVEDVGSEREVAHVPGVVDLHVAGEAAAHAAGEWSAGRRMRVRATLRWPAVAYDPGARSPVWQALVRRFALVGSVKSAGLVAVTPGRWWDEMAARVRRHVRQAIGRSIGRLDTRAAGIVTAIVIGDRAGLDPATVQQLQDAGTYHIVAISGGNVAVVVALVVVAIRGLVRSFRRVSVAALATVVVYGWVIGGDPSVDRAVAAAVCYLAADLTGLVVAPLDILAFVAVVLVVCDPVLAVIPAAWLSFGATLGLVLGADWLTARLSGAAPAAAWLARPWRWLSALLAATLAAEVILLPVSVAVFARVTVAGLVLNLIAIPAMAIVEIGGWIIVLGGAVPGITWLTAWPVTWATQLFVGSASWVRFAPWCTWRVAPPSSWWVLGFYGCVAAAWRLRRPRWRATAVAAAAAALVVMATAPGLEWAAPHRGWLRVTMLDVGQGDAILLQFPSGQSLLVDAGTASDAFDDGERIVTPALWALGVRRLDWIAFTHPDLDHIGGVGAAAAVFHPREIWEGVPVAHVAARTALHANALAAALPWRQVRAGDALEVGAVRIDVLNPAAPDWERQRTRNDDSIVLRVRYGEVESLLTGDISANVEPLIASAGESRPALRLLKVAHHGSRTSSSPAFLSAYRPALAVISVGRQNHFGHPSAEALARLAGVGAQVLRTDQDGAVIVETDGHEIRARTWLGREWTVRLLPAPL